MRALLAAAIVAVPTAVGAAPICGSFDMLKAQLQGKYQETYAAGGQINPATTFIILSSPAGETWTAVVVDAHGTACVIASGRGWDAMPTGSDV